MVKIAPSEITPESLYLSRRKFIKSVGALAAGSLIIAACGPADPSPQAAVNPTVRPLPSATAQASSTLSPSPAPTNTLVPSATPPLTPEPTLTATPEPTPTPLPDGLADEMGNALTSYGDATGVNNFYEFTFNKTKVASEARDFKTSPWSVQVGGLVNKPREFDLDALMKLGQEERIYRMRCVETWAMVLPWVGFSLARLLKEVEPQSKAKYVQFKTLYDPEQMPQQSDTSFSWPYVEGLRLDEAMNDLTLLATGMYGKPLPVQNGAPVRLVVPWKYGFKSIKSVVQIDLVEHMPVSLWMDASPREYGFYANVNPKVAHPRWSQETERRIGELESVQTLMFNGYQDQVAHLYEGMDLSVWF